MKRNIEDFFDEVNHERPKLKVPKFEIDAPLSKKLEKDPLMRNMNKSFAVAFIGKAGSGKTSLAQGLLSNKDYFAGVFHFIQIFMPPNSRSALSESIFSELPPEQVFDHLTLINLNKAFQRIEVRAREKKWSLIILDDVQQFLKGECEHLLLHMINNRRANRLSVMIMAQSYNKIPRAVRQALTDIFVFQVSPSDHQKIREELMGVSKHAYAAIMEELESLRENIPDEKHFLYVNVGNEKYFLDWTELIQNES